ncbi:MAG: GIY-YIG nuclease family protein [Patescibacteria group bacterium]
MFYVYLLKSLKRSEYYVGSTRDLQRRIEEHNDGKSPATKRYKPWQLVYYEAFKEEQIARMREHNLKHNGNAIRELRKRLGFSAVKKHDASGDLPSTTLPGIPRAHRQSGAGFTLVEITVAMGITFAMLAFFLANYTRGNKDSVLNREVNLVMANMRYAQELTSSGRTVKYCSFFSGQQCVTDADCRCKAPTNCLGITGTATEYDVCTDEKSPPGGYAVVFSCTIVAAVDNTEGPNKGYIPFQYPHTIGSPTVVSNNSYPINYYGKRSYSIFADVLACKQSVNDDGSNKQGCFQSGTIPINPYKPWQGQYISDGVIHYLWHGQSFPGYRGDTLKEMYTLSNDVEVRDIRITALDGVTSSQCTNTSRWRINNSVTNPGGVPNTNSPSLPNGSIDSGLAPVGDNQNYPIQAVVRFLPPDGRKVQINDNVTSSPPTATWQIDPNNPWAKAEVILGIVKRTKDCRVITVDQTGAISQSGDADCTF